MGKRISMVEMERKIKRLRAENRKLTDSVTASMTDTEYTSIEKRCTEIHHAIDALILSAY